MYTQIKQCLPFFSNSVKMKKNLLPFYYTLHWLNLLKSEKVTQKKHIHWLYRLSAHFSFPGSSEVLDSFITMYGLQSLAQWKTNTAITGVSVSSGLGLHFHSSLWTSALTIFKSFQKTHMQNPKKIFFFWVFVSLFFSVCFVFCFGFLFCKGRDKGWGVMWEAELKKQFCLHQTPRRSRRDTTASGPQKYRSQNLWDMGTEGGMSLTELFSSDLYLSVRGFTVLCWDVQRIAGKVGTQLEGL